MKRVTALALLYMTVQRSKLQWLYIQYDEMGDFSPIVVKR
jgi:hypothetical protein